MEHVQDLWQHVALQKAHLENKVKNLRTLFKPWPPPQSEIKSTADQSSNNASGERKKENSPDPDNCKPSMTEEEQEGVALVDKLLQKAQKARTVQKKLEEPKRARDLKGSKSNVQNHILSEEQKTVQSTVGINRKSIKENASTIERQSLKGKNGVVEKEQRNVQPISNTQTKRVNSGQDKKSNYSSATRTSVKQPSGTSHQHRSGPRQGSGQSKQQPIHSSAPFQTDPRLNSTKLQTTYRASTAKTMAKARADSAKNKIRNPAQNVSSSAGRDSPTESVQSDRSKLSYPKTRMVIESDIQTESDSDRANSKHKETCDENNSRISKDRHNCDNGSDGLSKMVENMNLRQKEGSASTMIPDNWDNKRFQLLTDGASLTLPTVYKKHVHMNRKLREKVCAQNVTKKVNAPTASQDFAEHLKQTFFNDSIEEVHTQGNQAQKMVDVYDSLYGLLDRLNLDNISDESSIAVVLRAKKLLEYILIKFQETEQLLHSSDFRLLSSVNGGHSKAGQKINKPDKHPPSIWYSPKHPLPRFDSVSVYKYRAFKQLEVYITLVYNIQWYQLQMDLIDTTAQLILPLLQSMDPSSSEFVHVLRAGYSMLAINPNKGPVLVRDTIQDTSMLETDETNS